MSHGAETQASCRQQVTEWYAANRDGVYRSLIAAGLDPAMAEEITQDAFLQLYGHLRNGGTVENARAWVYRVAQHAAIDAFRRQVREAPLPEGGADALPNGSRSQEEELIEKQRQAGFRKAIQQLSSRQRVCLELRAQGMSYREIAGTLEISISSVGEFLRRGAEQLRKWNHARNQTSR